VPIEFAERFCFYGISPLLNVFFRDYMGLGAVAAIVLAHAFKFLCYFTAGFGAALSDLALGKYSTIVLVTVLYILGVATAAVFSAPYALGILPNLPLPALWGCLVGFFFVAFGTGGIKSGVSALGGDQFLKSQRKKLENFYATFYWAINGGSFFAGIVTPIIIKQKCYSGASACYPEAFGLCAGIMVLALVLFLSGTRTYRIFPKSGTYIPWVALKIIFSSNRNYLKATRLQRRNSLTLEFANKAYSKEIIKDVRELLKFSALL
jgi:dipeptide/tripeptide permease